MDIREAALPIAGPPQVGSRGIIGQLGSSRCYSLLDRYGLMTAYFLQRSPSYSPSGRGQWVSLRFGVLCYPDLRGGPGILEGPTLLLRVVEGWHLSVLCGQEPHCSLPALPLQAFWLAGLGDQSGGLQMAWPACSHGGCGYPE